LRERHSNHFESGMQCFPYDFPGARSYNLYSNQQKEKHEQEYLKKPPAKRVNYKKLQVTSPFEPGFEALVGIEPTKDGKDTPQIGIKQKLWLFRGAKNIKLLETYCLPTCSDNVEDFLVKFKAQIRDSFAKRGVSLFPEYSDCWNLEQTLVNVRINLLARGCPKSNAIIYKIGKRDVYQKWEKKITNNRDLLTDDIDDKDIPCVDDIIGYITTGQFSFSQGHGFGIGCCSVVKCLEMIKVERRYI
ncbi:16571_t:CDS:2, partial [Racocetra persica]